MTREEAIEILWQYDVNFEPHPAEKVMHAIDMAIEALHREEAEEKGYCHRIKPKEDFKIDDIPRDWTPTILGNVEVVVRCKDCRWYSVKGKTTMYGWCDANWISVNETDYCSKGERKGGDDE